MRVCIIPEFPMSLMTGGLQVQAEETCWAINQFGQDMRAELFNWSEVKTQADVYHFVNISSCLADVAELLRLHRRPYVMTILFGSSRRTLPLWIAAARRIVKSRVLRIRGRYESVQGAARIITITQADARAARIIYGLERSKIAVVPNAVKDEFFAASPEPWRARHGPEPFVICVGAVQPRKGQLLLAEACNRLRLPLVLQGPVLPTQKDYGEQVAAAMRENARFGGRWMQEISHEDPLRISALAAAGLFVLLSNEETQPLSVMMAMAARTPILLLDAPYVNEPPFAGLPRAASPRLDDVCAALQREWQRRSPTALPGEFVWPGVTRALQTIYREALAESTVAQERARP